MQPLIGTPALQSDDLIAGGPHGGGGALTLQQAGRAPVPRLHLPAVSCCAQADAERGSLEYSSSQAPKTSRIQAGGVACGAHRHLQLRWDRDAAASTTESVLHLCTYRGDPRRALQIGVGVPQGGSQGSPSATPSALLHAFAQAKCVDRLGEGESPFSSHKKRQLEQGVHALKTIRTPDGAGAELRGIRGVSASAGGPRIPHAVAHAAEQAEAEDGCCSSQQQQQQQKQQHPVAARLRLDLGSVVGALETSPRSPMSLRAPLGAALVGPSSPCKGAHMGRMRCLDTAEAVAARCYTARLQQHNEWHAERFSPLQLQARRQQQQQQQHRRGHLTARACTLGAQGWPSGNSHLQGVLLCSERAPRSNVQSLVQQLEARRLRSKGGGALRSLGSPLACSTERDAVRFRGSLGKDAAATGAADALPTTAAAGGLESAPRDAAMPREGAGAAETAQQTMATCGAGGAGQMPLDESWGAGGPQGCPLGSPLLQAALARGAPEKVVGSYLLGRTIGEGTFGKVRVATHALTGECVAVKVLEKEKLKAAEDAERVLREIHILRAVRHPHIIHLLEILETASRLYLVMELASGGELFDFIVKRQKVDEQTARRLFRQILSGVEALHSLCICHRDLKPENLLLDSAMNIKIVDFGLSNIYSHKPMLKTACGSPSYAAPEIVQGKLYSPLAVDIWSCGVILYALLVGRLPFEENTTEGLYRSIVSGKFCCPDHLSPEACSLLKGILNTCPLKRLGPLQIKQHPWLSVGRAQHIPHSLCSSRWPSGPPVCSLKDCRACAEWLAPPSAQLRRDVLEQMPPSNYSLEALECHIRCHPVGAHAATYYLLCLKKRREEEAAAAAAGAGKAVAVSRQQHTPRSVPSSKGPPSATDTVAPPAARNEPTKDNLSSITHKQEPTAGPPLAAASRVLDPRGTRMPLSRSGGAPREVPKAAPSKVVTSLAQKRMKGSCSSDASLQQRLEQRLQQQRQQHKLQLAEQLLQPLVCRSTKSRPGPSTSSNPTGLILSSSADMSPQAKCVQLSQSESAREPEGLETLQQPQEKPPPATPRRNLQPKEEGTVEPPIRQSAVKHTQAPREVGPDLLQQQEQGLSPTQKQFEPVVQQQQQNQQEQRHSSQHQSLPQQHPPQRVAVETDQTLPQQKTSCTALQLTQLMMRTMYVTHHQQLRLQQTADLEGTPVTDNYPLRGLLTARGHQPHSATLSCLLGPPPASPGRALQSLLSPRCLLSGGELRCKASTQQRQQVGNASASVGSAAPCSSPSMHQDASAHADTPQSQQADAQTSTAPRPTAIKSTFSRREGAALPGTMPCAYKGVANTPLLKEDKCKRMQAEDQQQIQGAADATAAASSTPGIPNAYSRSPTCIKKGTSSYSSSSSNSCAPTGKPTRAASLTSSSEGAGMRNRKPPGPIGCVSLQKQQRQNPLQRGQQPPFLHSSTWQTKRGSIRGEQQRLIAAATGRSATATNTPRAPSRGEATTVGPPVAKAQGKAGVSKGPPKRVAPLRLSLSTGCALPAIAAAATAASSSMVERRPVGVCLDDGLRRRSLEGPPHRGSLTARTSIRSGVPAGGKAATTPSKDTRRLGSRFGEGNGKAQDSEKPFGIRANSSAFSSRALQPPLSARKPSSSSKQLPQNAAATGVTRVPPRSVVPAGAPAAAAKATTATTTGTLLLQSRHRSLTAEGLPSDRSQAPVSTCGIFTGTTAAQKATTAFKGYQDDSRMQRICRTGSTTTSLTRRSAAGGGLPQGAGAAAFTSGSGEGLRPAAAPASNRTLEGRAKVSARSTTSSTKRSNSGVPGLLAPPKATIVSRGGLHPMSLLSTRASVQLTHSNRKQQLQQQQSQQQQQPKRGSLLRCRTAGTADENRKNGRKPFQGIPSNRSSLPKGAC